MDASIKLTVPPAKRNEMLQAIKAILEPVRLERGCINCHCYVDIEAENSIYIREEWETRDDLGAHVRSVHFGVLLGAMKMLTEEPEIRFNSIISTTGVEELKGTPPKS